MTIEEAFERAKAAHGTGAYDDATLEFIFPELTESEDERIRKRLVRQVHRNIEDETNDLTRSVYNGIKGHHPDLEESIEDWKKCLAWLEKQKEKKPAEWSNEDEKMRNALWSLLKIQYAQDYSMTGVGIEAGKFRNWLNSLPKDSILQPKQEWSKGDEENFEWFDKFFRAESVVAGGKDIPQDKYLWFKSLRPSWKPSDEQPEMNIPSAGSGAMGTTPPKFKLDVKQDLPVGLEKEIKEYLEKLGGGHGGFVDDLTDDDLTGFARHFYKLGLKARKL